MWAFIECIRDSLPADEIECVCDHPAGDDTSGKVHRVRCTDLGARTERRRDLRAVLKLVPDGCDVAWSHFSRVNLRFASKASSLALPGASAVVMADGLYLTPRLLRRLRPDLTIDLVAVEPMPLPDVTAGAPAGVRTMLGMLGADNVWFADAASRRRFEAAAVALELVDRVPGSIVHLGRTVELRILR